MATQAPMIISVEAVLGSSANGMFKHYKEKGTDLKGIINIKYSTVVSFLTHSSPFLRGSGSLLCLLFHFPKLHSEL